RESSPGSSAPSPDDSWWFDVVRSKRSQDQLTPRRHFSLTAGGSLRHNYRNIPMMVQQEEALCFVDGLQDAPSDTPGRAWSVELRKYPAVIGEEHLFPPKRGSKGERERGEGSVET